MIDEPERWQVQVVTVGNDTRTDSRGTYRVRDADSGETLLSGAFGSRANSNASLGAIRVSRSDQRLFLIDWSIEGVTYGNHYLLGTPPFSLERYRGWLVEIAKLPSGFDVASVGR